MGCQRERRDSLLQTGRLYEAEEEGCFYQSLGSVIVNAPIISRAIRRRLSTQPNVMPLHPDGVPTRKERFTSTDRPPLRGGRRGMFLSKLRKRNCQRPYNLSSNPTTIVNTTERHAIAPRWGANAKGEIHFYRQAASTRRKKRDVSIKA